MKELLEHRSALTAQLADCTASGYVGLVYALKDLDRLIEKQMELPGINTPTEDK